MKKVIFKNKHLVYQPRGKGGLFDIGDTKADLITLESLANDGQGWAIINKENEILRNHEKIGEYKDLVFAGVISKKEIEKHKIKTKSVEFEELEKETITSFKLIEPPAAFWGDQCERYEIKTKSGKAFWMTTGGGSNLMGFPGSQSHGVWLQELTP